MANRKNSEMRRRGDHLLLDTHLDPRVIGIEMEHSYVDVVGADANQLFFDAPFAQVQGDLGVSGGEGTGDCWNHMGGVRAEVGDGESPGSTVSDRARR